MKLQLFILAIILLPIVSADSGTPSTPNYAGTPPAFGVDQNVPSNVAWRAVYGSVTVAASAVAAGLIRLQTCAGTNLQSLQIAAGGGSQTWAYMAIVRGGDCYEFVNVADPVPLNAISQYNTFDVLNQSFEGRDHANVTRIEMNDTRTTQNHAQNTTRTTQNDIQNNTLESQAHANSTWESQTHANSTWCPLTGAGCFVPFPDANGNFTGNFTGDFSGDFNSTNATGNFSGNYTITNATGNLTGNFSGGSFNGNITASSISQSFGNVTQIFNVSNETMTDVSLAVDGYLPLLVYGGGVVLFMWLNAMFPAIAMFLAFGDSFLPTPVLGREGRFMLVGIALILHLILAKMAGWYKGFAGGYGEESPNKKER